MTEQTTWTALAPQHDTGAIMICGECLKPLRFEAVSTGAHHTQQPETVPCPYGPHEAGTRDSVGWWQSYPLSPEQQVSWLVGIGGRASRREVDGEDPTGGSVGAPAWPPPSRAVEG